MESSSESEEDSEFSDDGDSSDKDSSSTSDTGSSGSTIDPDDVDDVYDPDRRTTGRTTVAKSTRRFNTTKASDGTIFGGGKSTVNINQKSTVKFRDMVSELSHPSMYSSSYRTGSSFDVDSHSRSMSRSTSTNFSRSTGTLRSTAMSSTGRPTTKSTVKFREFVSELSHPSL